MQAAWAAERGLMVKCFKVIKPLDWVLLAVAVFLLAETDFRHMTMFDQIYVGAVGLYSILLVVRVVLEYRKNTAGQDTTQK